MAFRVAVASSDGLTIDLHFGEANTFYIYDIEQDTCAFVEKRSVLRNIGHDVTEFGRVSEFLKDCEAVLVSRIGPGAAKTLLQTGLRVFEAPYPVHDVLEKVREQNLLANN
jgi:nitrogen fixation protein NifX